MEEHPTQEPQKKSLGCAVKMIIVLGCVGFLIHTVYIVIKNGTHWEKLPTIQDPGFWAFVLFVTYLAFAPNPSKEHP